MKITQYSLTLFVAVVLSTAGSQNAHTQETAEAPQAEIEASAQTEKDAVEPEKEVTETSDAPSNAAPKKEKKAWTDVIDIKGDFRYRLDIENIDDQNDTKVRHRHRIRGRLGMQANLPQGFKAMFQLATGSSDPVSTNQTLSDAFASKPVWINLAYAGWYPDFAKGLAVEAGKMKNPFFTIKKTGLIFDSDITPEGAAIGYKNTFGIAEPFFQTAAFYIQERKNADDSWLLGIQGGVKLTLAGGIVHLLMGASYFDYTRIKGNLGYYDETDSFGNTATAELSDPTDADSDMLQRYDNDYNLVEGFFEVGGKISKFPWAVFTDIVYNAAADDDNLGWLAGVSFGKCKKPLDFSLKYTYRQLQADAVVGAFADSDFAGGGTDAKGHVWNVGFQVAEPLALGVSYLFNKAPIDNSENYNRGQIDLKLKF